MQIFRRFSKLFSAMRPIFFTFGIKKIHKLLLRNKLICKVWILGGRCCRANFIRKCQTITVSGASYCDKIIQFFVLDIARWMWFQYASATCQKAQETIQLLHEPFSGHVILSFGDRNSVLWCFKSKNYIKKPTNTYL